MAFLQVLAIFIAFVILFIFLLSLRIKYHRKIRKLCINRRLYNIKKEFSKSLNIETIVVLTVIWIFVIVYLYVDNSNSLYSNIKSTENTSEMVSFFALNNLGDYLAGLFAPILFTWVVFGIFLQKKEFSNAIDEYKRSIKFLKKQSINTDIQHKNSWFDRNAEMLEKYIDKLIQDNGPLNDLNIQILGQNIYTFRDIVSDVLNIVELNQYITTSLKNSRNHESSFNEAIDKLETEYEILFGKNIRSTKKIAFKFYLHTFRSKLMIENKDELKEHDEFKKFYNLDLLTEKKEQDILTLQTKFEVDINKNFVDIISQESKLDIIDTIINEEKINEKTI